VTLTGDVHQGVSPGPQCEESRPIPNAGKGNRYKSNPCRAVLRKPHDGRTHLAAEGIELARYDSQHKLIR